VRRAAPSELEHRHNPEGGAELDPKKGGHSRWIINDGSDGIFDAVIVTVGTCGVPE